MPDGEIIVGHDVDGNPVRVRVVPGEVSLSARGNDIWQQHLDKLGHYGNMPATVRTFYYRGIDCYRVVVCAGDKELNTVDVVTTGGPRGRDQAEAAAESAAFIRMLPTSWIDVP